MHDRQPKATSTHEAQRRHPGLSLARRRAGGCSWSHPGGPFWKNKDDERLV
jgi:predicted NUDIX family NTP pyrophosphohydrolase